MRAFWAIALCSLTLGSVACDDDSNDQLPMGGGRDATATSSTADARTSSTADGSVTRQDAGGMDAAGMGRDATPAGDTGSSSGTDGGPLGPVCTELEGCCGELPVPQVQMQCLALAGMGDENACAMRLQQARDFGQCLPANHDAGPQPDGNSGNLTPECAALEPCCAQAGQLQTICDNIVMRNNPSTCQTVLDQLAGRGIMCGPMSGDAGEPPDSGPPMGDAGTSTVGGDR